MGSLGQKKQAWHDKIAGTVVVKTDKQPKTILGIFLVLLTFILIFVYFGAVFYKAFMFGFQGAKDNSALKESLVQNERQKSEEKDKDNILSFAPSSCGISIPVPKTTDTLQGKNRKWLFEEVPLAPNTFYVLDKDVYSIKEVQGVFIGHKDASARLGGESFFVAFPGINVYCADNIKSLTLEEYKSLALANKNYKVTLDKDTYFGEVKLISIWVEGKTETGQQLKEPAYIGVTKDGTKLLYVRIWAAEKNDPKYKEISDDVDLVIRDLKYRKSDGSAVKAESNVNVEINSNVKGVNTIFENTRIK